MIATCESELETAPDPLRAARLHYEIARAYEVAIGWSEQAAEHYRKSLDGAPEYMPSICGARRAEIVRGNFEAALTLFDAEDKLDVVAEAQGDAVLRDRAGSLEDRMSDATRARDALREGARARSRRMRPCSRRSSSAIDVPVRPMR